MLDLDSLKWKKLEDAYGSAEKLPLLINQLSVTKEDEELEKIWSYVWGSLCHQGDVYNATFAAIPHLVEIVKKNKNEINLFNLFSFLTSVEISNQVLNIENSTTIESFYRKALHEAKDLIKESLETTTNYTLISTLLAFQAVMKNQYQLAELLLTIQESELSEVTAWYFRDKR